MTTNFSTANNLHGIGYAAAGPNQTALSAEASSLGWPAGQWARSVTVDGVDFAMSRGERDREGDLVCVKYIAKTGAIFVVFND